MTERPLDGLVAIVTGAGRGIGRSHAEFLASQGAEVFANDVPHSRADLDETVAAIHLQGNRAHAAPGDVADWQTAETLIKDTVDTAGDLNILVNNAGIVRLGTVEETDESTWDEVLRVNTKGHIGPCRFAAEHWRRRHASGQAVHGRIINTTSGAAVIGLPEFAAYDVSKAAVIGLTLVLANELLDLGVTVNAIAPYARTRMTERLNLEPEPDDGAFDALHPRNNSPVVGWLAGAAAGHVTGQIIAVTGPTIDLLGPVRPIATMSSSGTDWTVDAIASMSRDWFAGSGQQS